MGERHAGSCLCGGVRFELDGKFEHFYLCHCSYCRKDTGSAHAANLFSPMARLEWLAGRELLRSYQLPGTRHARSFCAVCGSALPHQNEAMWVVPAGCLETAPNKAPDAHIFHASRAAWEQQMEAAPVFAALPG